MRLQFLIEGLLLEVHPMLRQNVLASIQDIVQKMEKITLANPDMKFIPATDVVLYNRRGSMGKSIFAAGWHAGQIKYLDKTSNVIINLDGSITLADLSSTSTHAIGGKYFADVDEFISEIKGLMQQRIKRRKEFLAKPEIDRFIEIIKKHVYEFVDRGSQTSKGIYVYSSRLERAAEKANITLTNTPTGMHDVDDFGEHAATVYITPDEIRFEPAENKSDLRTEIVDALKKLSAKMIPKYQKVRDYFGSLSSKRYEDSK